MLASLAAYRFRNLLEISWKPGEGSHLLLGGNGAGKTSVLEALHLVATTRSFRTARLEDCATRASRGSPAAASFGVRAEVGGPPRAELFLGWGEQSGLERTLNGRSVSLAEHLSVLPVVTWTVRDSDILAGVPERRRRMVDAGLVAERPARLELLRRYRQTLTQKRELFRRGQKGLEEWNRLLAAAAVELACLRQDWLERLQGRLERCMEEAAPELPHVRLRYEPSPQELLQGEQETLERLRQVEEEERRLGRPLLGPHRDRVSILWRGVDVSRVASAGERKALGLLLTSARAEVLEASAAREAVVLADDVDAELDLQVLGNVWRVLRRGRQVFATSNRQEIRDRLSGASVWVLTDGRMASERHL